MCISFDIDNTLITTLPETDADAGVLPRVLQQRFIWPLRFGTRKLMRELQQHGHRIWVYTSSGRGTLQIRLWLLFHGVLIDGVVNERLHRKELSDHRFDRLPSKYPPAFGIDLHVDDSEGVRMEADEYGFRVIVIAPNDKQWTDKVLAAVNKLAN